MKILFMATLFLFSLNTHADSCCIKDHNATGSIIENPQITQYKTVVKKTLSNHKRLSDLGFLWQQKKMPKNMDYALIPLTKAKQAFKQEKYNLALKLANEAFEQTELMLNQYHHEYSGGWEYNYNKYILGK